MVASWTEAVIFSRALHARAHVAVERFVAVPAGSAFAAAALGLALHPPMASRLACGDGGRPRSSPISA